MQRVLIIGLGVSGKAAASFLLKQGALVTAVDDRPIPLEQPEVAALLKQGLLLTSVENLSAFDLVVVSPGVPFSHPLYSRARREGKEIVGEIELACRSFRNQAIGITGTNGKTTVTLLVTHILCRSGFKARALGNVGTPLISEVAALCQDEIAVIELSSYQLETMHAQVLDCAAILNITPDHLDRYANMQAYAQAKSFIQRCLKPNKPLYVSQEVAKRYGELLSPNRLCTYGYSSDCFIFTDKKHIIYNQNIEYILPISYRDIISHDVENIIAAFALCREFGVTAEQFDRALATFKKPPHRMEFVRLLNGVAYVDDSKGTNVDAVIRAVGTIKEPIHLIAGGVDKGWSYCGWLEPFKGKVKAIYAIGQAAEKMAQELGRELPILLCTDLEEAVSRAHLAAQAGECVLLSPGCSSFDMFRDYAHRGQNFQRLVSQL